MEPIIDLAPGAEENPLASDLADLVRRNVTGSRRKNLDFRSLRGSVLVVAQDTQAVLTMRFDHGRLTIHEGSVGIPSVTLCGDEQVLRDLGRMGLSPRLRLPRVFSRDLTHVTLLDFVKAITKQRLTVYGLLSHPRLLLSLVRVLSDERRPGIEELL